MRGFRAGRERLWELRPQQLENARRFLDLFSSRWDQALGRLKLAVEKESG